LREARDIEQALELIVQILARTGAQVGAEDSAGHGHLRLPEVCAGIGELYLAVAGSLPIDP
jgi:hypothetical protein